MAQKLLRPSSSDTKNIRWNGVIWQLFHLGGGGLFLIILWAVLGRYWSVEGFGQFNYIFAYISIAGIFIDFGLDVLLTRTIAHDNGNIPASYWKLKFLCSAIFLSCFFILGLVLAIPTLVLFCLLAGSVALSFTAFLNALLRARDKLDIEAKIGVIQKSIFILVSIYGVSFLQMHMLWVAQCYAISHFFALVLTLLSIKKQALINPLFAKQGTSIPKTDSSRTVFFSAWPLFLVALLGVLTLRIDIFLLQALLGDAAVGIYTAAMRLVEGTIVLGSAYQAAIFPKIVKQLKQADKFNHLFYQAIKHLLIGALLITIPGVFLSSWLIELLYGEDFSQSSEIFVALLPAILLVYQTTLLGSIVVALSKQTHYLVMLAIALAINVLIDYFAILAFATMGAVIGFWIKEISLILMLWLYIRYYFTKTKK